MLSKRATTGAMVKMENTPFFYDTIIFILGLIITLSSFYVIYVHIKLYLEWFKWYLYALTGIIIMTSAMLAGIIGLVNVYKIFLSYIAIVICVESLMHFIRNACDYRFN